MVQQITVNVPEGFIVLTKEEHRQLIDKIKYSNAKEVNAMGKPVTINIEEVKQNPERAKIKYGNKEVVCKMYSMNKYTLNDWLTDIRKNPEFADAVVNPTHKIVLINLDRFEDYFRWLEKNRYRR